MVIKFYKAYSPGTRHRSGLFFDDVTSKKRNKKLTFFFQRAKGRNNRGIITSKCRGKGHKRLYRKIDFQRNKLNIVGKISTIEYDPNRNTKIALISYRDGEKRYIICPNQLKIGSKIISSVKASISPGNSLPLFNIPLGTEIHNVELYPGKGGQLARAAGTKIQIIAKENNYVTLRLPSGELRLVLKNCWATIGQVGNVFFNKITKGKAGRNCWLGKRPKVRGVVMNPVDHPHGGGEGRVLIGRTYPVTPWGMATLGKKTRKLKKYSNFLIIGKRKK